jgi:hypothetical protein
MAPIKGHFYFTFCDDALHGDDDDGGGVLFARWPLCRQM